MKMWALLLSCFSVAANADMSLPLNTLRTQGTTAHCWTYAMAHLLESRALHRDGMDVRMDNERDTKFWVDYERMLYMYRSKNSFYLGEYEGGWQIEYWETLLKHGRPVAGVSQASEKQARYKPLQPFKEYLPFFPVERKPRKPGEYIDDEVSDHLRFDKFASDQDAIDYIVNLLLDVYGMPAASTAWLGKELPLQDSAKQVLASDYQSDTSVDSFVLVVPATDGDLGWVKYLDNRYWGYRLEKAKILDLLETSLRNGWPVTYDNVSHAKTIIGYSTSKDDRYFAVADSQVNGQMAQISWYPSAQILRDLHLVTFFRAAIPGKIPDRHDLDYESSGRAGKNYDLIDNLMIPPGKW